MVKSIKSPGISTYRHSLTNFAKMVRLVTTDLPDLLMHWNIKLDRYKNSVVYNKFE